MQRLKFDNLVVVLDVLSYLLYSPGNDCWNGHFIYWPVAVSINVTSLPAYIPCYQHAEALPRDFAHRSMKWSKEPQFSFFYPADFAFLLRWTNSSPVERNWKKLKLRGPYKLGWNSKEIPCTNGKKSMDKIFGPAIE